MYLYHSKTCIFVKIHGSDNLTADAKQSRENTLMQYPEVTERWANTGWDLDLPLTKLELRRAITIARQTSPGKDGICYEMLANMKDSSLIAILKMFNLIWETGQIPSAWKQSVIVSILKPGNVPSDPTSYRPIALTSHLGKTMERMVTQRLTHHVESKNLISPHQSGFRKGRNTMDSVLCLESEIRKAQANKDMVVFF